MKTAYAQLGMRNTPPIFCMVGLYVDEKMQPANDNITQEGWAAHGFLTGYEFQKKQEGYCFKVWEIAGTWDCSITAPDGGHLAFFMREKSFEDAVALVEHIYQQEKIRLKWHRLLNPFFPPRRYYYMRGIDGQIHRYRSLLKPHSPIAH